MPVLFFGNILTARYATLGLNPSDQEYLAPDGRELNGADRRFETLRSLRAKTRQRLTKPQCLKALQTMRRYFDDGKPVYRWFKPLERVLNGMGVSYTRGEAVHLDLVQEPTNPTWSTLRETRYDEWVALRRADLPFLRAQLARLAPRLLLCNGRTPREQLEELAPIRLLRSGRKRLIEWFVGTIKLDGCRVRVAGWNIPLAQPTGLTKAGLAGLGKLFVR